VFNPTETADNLKKHGGFIPASVGERTAEYIDYVLSRSPCWRDLPRDRLPDSRNSDFLRLGPFYFGGLRCDRRQRDDGYGGAVQVICWPISMKGGSGNQARGRRR